MKTLALAAALALLVGAAGPASAVDVIASGGTGFAARPALFAPTAGDLAPAPLPPAAWLPATAPASAMSELPEPDVFLMMLLGLCLIGYRASRVSDEKFK